MEGIVKATGVGQAHFVSSPEESAALMAEGEAARLLRLPPLPLDAETLPLDAETPSIELVDGVPIDLERLRVAVGGGVFDVLARVDV